MATMAMMVACRKLEDEGLHPVRLWCGMNSPIPGLVMFADEAHRRLEMVRPDGSTIDLLAVHRTAEDCVRNWHVGSPPSTPHFVGDFGRLTLLAQALNGKQP